MRELKNRYFAVLILAFVVEACASSQPTVVTCNPTVGDSCAAESEDNEIIWNAGSAKPGDQFVLVAMSRAWPRNEGEYEHDFEISPRTASGSINAQESRAIEGVRALYSPARASIVNQTDETIPPPRFANQRARQSIGDIRPIYVPNPNDYFTYSDERVSRIIVHDPSDQLKSGVHSDANVLLEEPNRFTLEINQRNTMAEGKINKIKACVPQASQFLRENISEFLSVGGSRALRVLLTEFPNGQWNRSSRTLGLFSAQDQFSHLNGRPMTDTNFSNLISITTSLVTAENACSILSHEGIHLLSLQNKALKRMPESERHDQSAMARYGLFGELEGKDEGLAHNGEELSGFPNSEQGQMAWQFLVQPQGASWYIETAKSDPFMNRAGRGANLLMVKHLTTLKGGTHQLGDAKALQVQRDLVTRPGTGYEDMANYMGWSTLQLFQSFFTNLVKVLFDVAPQSAFIPDFVGGVSPDYNRGVFIRKRSDDTRNISVFAPYVHPYQFPLKVLSINERKTVNAGSMHFYRYVVPAPERGPAEVRVNMGGKPIYLFVIAVPSR